jgi:cell division protein FtsZ
VKNKNFQTTRIKIIGVVGGGNNAVNQMISAGLEGVEYWAVNNAFKRPNTNPLKNILIIGQDASRDIEKGSSPLVGKKAAEESIEDIRKMLSNTDMVFVTAGIRLCQNY